MFVFSVIVRMPSIISSFPIVFFGCSNLDSASAFEFVEPFLYLILKGYISRKSTIQILVLLDPGL